MTKRRSGLADSPFFAPQPVREPSPPPPSESLKKKPKPLKKAVKKTKRSTDRKGQTTKKVIRPKRSHDRHPKKTPTKRRAFDFTEAQLESVRRIRATRELNENRSVSMSEIMREAVDLLLEKEGLK